eukprot:410599_1
MEFVFENMFCTYLEYVYGLVHYGQVIYGGLIVVDMMEVIKVIVEGHIEKDMLDMVVIVWVHTVEILVLNTHMMVMVDTVDMIYLQEHIVNLVEGEIYNKRDQGTYRKGGGEEICGEVDEGTDRKN